MPFDSLLQGFLFLDAILIICIVDILRIFIKVKLNTHEISHLLYNSELNIL